MQSPDSPSGCGPLKSAVFAGRKAKLSLVQGGHSERDGSLGLTSARDPVQCFHMRNKAGANEEIGPEAGGGRLARVWENGEKLARFIFLGFQGNRQVYIMDHVPATMAFFLSF